MNIKNSNKTRINENINENINDNYNKSTIKSKKGMELPINIVVMMIIGIIIFGIGMSLFSKFSQSGDEQIEELNNKIKNNIASLECGGDEWICSASHKMKNGEEKTFEIFIANLGTNQADFKINIDGVTEDAGKKFIEKTDCGSVVISYPSISISIDSGFSGSIPFKIYATRVTKTPCSFIATAELLDLSNNIIEKTPVIIRVE